MPNELLIPAIQATQTTTEALKPPVKPSARAEAPAASARPFLNPSLRLDAALGLVVIEFRDDSGALTSTIPSERQIEAYRAHQDPRPAQAAEEGQATAEAARVTAHPAGREDPDVPPPPVEPKETPE